jgi:hypothetical protein
MENRQCSKGEMAFLNWVRLVIFVFLKKGRLATEQQRCAPVRGDNGSDRSLITRDFNKVSGKENGTIPF